MKLAVRRALSLDGVFINDLHKPFARILEDPIQTHSNTNLARGGSDLSMCPDPDQLLGGSDPSAFMATSPVNIVITALDPVNWGVALLAYLLEEVVPTRKD